MPTWQNFYILKIYTISYLFGKDLLKIMIYFAVFIVNVNIQRYLYL